MKIWVDSGRKDTKVIYKNDPDKVYIYYKSNTLHAD